MMAMCRACGEEKPVTAFYREPRKRSGLNAKCKACVNARSLAWAQNNPLKRRLTGQQYYLRNRERIKERDRAKYEETMAAKGKVRSRRIYHIARDYALMESQLREMLAAQNGKCQICAEMINFEGRRAAHVDHDHSTGKVRGILCKRCNSGLGLFLDSRERLIAAVKYLEGIA